MSIAKSLIKPQSMMTEFSSEDIIESIVLSGISDSNITIVDTLLQEIPESMQNNTSIQTLITEIGYLEKRYAPLVHEAQQIGIMANAERIIISLMFLLFGIGIIYSFNEFITMIVILGICIVTMLYIIAQGRISRGLKQDIAKIKPQLIEKIDELKNLQSNLQSNTSNI